MQEIDASISEGVLSYYFDFFVELGTPMNDIALNAFTHNAVIQLYTRWGITASHFNGQVEWK